jgi:hypothetical protein
MAKPHLSNLNEDPQLTRKVNYALDIECCNIGRRNSDPPNQIEIGGMGIRKLHASIIKSGEDFLIKSVSEGEESNCYLNGDLILAETKLFHLDRLSFGTNNMFLFLLPGSQPRSE